MATLQQTIPIVSSTSEADGRRGLTWPSGKARSLLSQERLGLATAAPFQDGRGMGFGVIS